MNSFVTMPKADLLLVACLAMVSQADAVKYKQPYKSVVRINECARFQATPRAVLPTNQCSIDRLFVQEMACKQY